MAASDHPERRSYERFDLLAQVRVRHGSVDHVLEVINVSRGGALVDLGTEPRPRWLELRRQLEVRILDSAGATLLDSRGQVVRIVETLAGRSFALELEAPIEEDAFRRLLRAAGKPPPLPPRGPSGGT